MALHLDSVSRGSHCNGSFNFLPTHPPSGSTASTPHCPGKNDFLSKFLGRIRLGYSGIRIYSGIYSGYSAPRGRIAGMGIFRNENSSQTNAYSYYSNNSYSGLIPNERALTMPRIRVAFVTVKIFITIVRFR